MLDSLSGSFSEFLHRSRQLSAKINKNYRPVLKKEKRIFGSAKIPLQIPANWKGPEKVYWEEPPIFNNNNRGCIMSGRHYE